MGGSSRPRVGAVHQAETSFSGTVIKECSAPQAEGPSVPGEMDIVPMGSCASSLPGCLTTRRQWGILRAISLRPCDFQAALVQKFRRVTHGMQSGPRGGMTFPISTDLIHRSSWFPRSWIRTCSGCKGNLHRACQDAPGSPGRGLRLRLGSYLESSERSGL